MFSKEYLFRECNMNNHCLGALLKEPIRWEDTLIQEIFIMEVVVTEEENEAFFKNILINAIESEGNIKIKAFIDDPHKTKTITIDTSNIFEIEKVE
jgi:regulatory protein YycH of two-component signal transduction system YycFG